MSAAEPTHVRFQVLAVACSLAVLTYVQRQGFIAATPFIKADLGLHDGHMGFLLGAWLIAYGLFQVPCGLIGDRLGARLLLTLLVVCWSLTLIAVALTVWLPPDGTLAFVALLILRFVFGGFQAGVFPGIARIVADWMPGTVRGVAQGTIWTCSRIGGAAAPVFAVWLITKVLHGWSQTITLVAVAGLIWSVMFWLWFRNRPEEMPQVNQAERELIARGRPVVAMSAAPRLPASVYLKSPSVWGLCLMYGFDGFGGNFITSFLPVYLRDHRHLPDATTAWMTGVPLGAGVISCLTGGATSDWLIRLLGNRKWGRRLVGIVAMSCAGAATLCTPWVTEVWQLALALGAWMFFNDAMVGPAWASCADIGERNAGTLSGAMNMTGAFAGAAGMTLAGWWLKAGHDKLVFIAFAGSYAIAALCWLLVDVTQPLSLEQRTSPAIPAS